MGPSDFLQSRKVILLFLKDQESERKASMGNPDEVLTKKGTEAEVVAQKNKEEDRGFQAMQMVELSSSTCGSEEEIECSTLKMPRILQTPSPAKQCAAEPLVLQQCDTVESHCSSSLLWLESSDNLQTILS